MVSVIEAFNRKALDFGRNKILYIPEEYWDYIDDFILYYSKLSDCKRKKILQNKKYTLDKLTYYIKVWVHTEANKDSIPNIADRGNDYHIDHIVPIIYGYRNGIGAGYIGGTDNLEVISGKANFKKNSLLSDKAKEILISWAD